MEVIKGSPNYQEQQRSIKLLRQLNFIELSPEDLHWAMEQQLKYQLSHGVGILDCLIAAPCARLQIPLYTRNLKHFTPLLGMLAISPY
jgi:predicted nucleic acid-binding protein